jgi:CheY-like chemotaxis protein
MSDAGADYILVMDDDEDIRLTLQQILDDEGCPALTPPTGRQLPGLPLPTNAQGMA